MTLTVRRRVEVQGERRVQPPVFPEMAHRQKRRGNGEELNQSHGVTFKSLPLIVQVRYNPLLCLG